MPTQGKCEIFKNKKFPFFILRIVTWVDVTCIALILLLLSTIRMLIESLTQLFFFLHAIFMVFHYDNENGVMYV